MNAHGRALFIAAGLVLGTLLSAGYPAPAEEVRQRSAAELMDAVMWGTEPIGGPFSLVDHTGKHRTDTEFRGKLLLIYFGFTFCPDICPTDLQVIGSAIEQLGPAGEGVQPLFITVDPERDTVGHLAQYVPMFHPRLIGLTGDAVQIRKAADAYKVYYAKIVDGSDFTTIRHSFIWWTGKGSILASFRPGHRLKGWLK